eukprot:Platyproteum_vivax@DN3120_c0_g1_i1.p1
MDLRHTIILCQFSKSTNSRVYLEYPTMVDALDGMCQLYEQSLKLEPNRAMNATVTYGIPELFRYLDNLEELAFMSYSSPNRGYLPFNRDWIKNRLGVYLSQQAKQV